MMSDLNAVFDRLMVLLSGSFLMDLNDGNGAFRYFNCTVEYYEFLVQAAEKQRK